MTDNKKLDAYVDELWKEYKHEIDTGGRPTVLVCSMSLLADLHRKMECGDENLIDGEFGNFFVSYEIAGAPGSSTACVGETVSETPGLVRLVWNGCNCKEYSHVFIDWGGQ